MNPSAAAAPSSPSDPPPPPPPPLILLDSPSAAASPSSSASSSAPPPPPPSPSPRHPQLKCPRCGSRNTKFCYYNNYSLTQPRHFCKNCRRYWTLGGALRNVPVGGGCRKNKRSSSSSSSSGTAAAPSLGSGFGFMNYVDPSSVAAAAQLIRADPISPMFRLDRYGSSADTSGSAFLTRLSGTNALFPHLGASAFLSDPATPPYFSSAAHYPNHPHPAAAAASCHDPGRRLIQGNNLFELNALNSSFQTLPNPSTAPAITQLLSNDKCHMQPDWLSLLQSEQSSGGNMVEGMNLSDSAVLATTDAANFIDIPDLIDTRFAATLPALRGLGQASGHDDDDDTMISNYRSLQQPQQQSAGTGSGCFVDVGGPNFFFHHLSSASESAALQSEMGGDRIMQQQQHDEAAAMDDCNSQTLAEGHVVDQEVFVEMGGAAAAASAEAVNSLQCGPQIHSSSIHGDSHCAHEHILQNDEHHHHHQIDAAVKEEDGARQKTHVDGHDGLIRRTGTPTSSLIMIGTEHPQLQRQIHLHDEAPRELLISSFSGFSLLQPSSTGAQPWTQAQHLHDLHHRHHHQQQQHSLWNVTEDVKQEEEQWQDMPPLIATAGTSTTSKATEEDDTRLMHQSPGGRSSEQSPGGHSSELKGQAID